MGARLDRPWVAVAFLTAAWSFPDRAAAQSVRLLVQSSPLAGFRHHAGPGLRDRLRPGERLALQREPDNPHDAHAVWAERQGETLGYLSRAENRIVADAMDGGAAPEARVSPPAHGGGARQGTRGDIYLVGR